METTVDTVVNHKHRSSRLVLWQYVMKNRYQFDGTKPCCPEGKKKKEKKKWNPEFISMFITAYNHGSETDESSPKKIPTLWNPEFISKCITAYNHGAETDESSPCAHVPCFF